jgi:hypothetical protein
MQQDLVDFQAGDLFDPKAMRDRHGRLPDLSHWREDILLTGYARRSGWTVDLKGDEKQLDSHGRLKVYRTDGRDDGDPHLNCTGESYVFRKGDQIVWFSVYEGPHWNRASNTTSGALKDRRRFPTLKEALDTQDAL